MRIGGTAIVSLMACSSAMAFLPAHKSVAPRSHRVIMSAEKTNADVAAFFKRAAALLPMAVSSAAFAAPINTFDASALTQYTVQMGQPQGSLYREVLMEKTQLEGPIKGTRAKGQDYAEQVRKEGGEAKLSVGTDSQSYDIQQGRNIRGMDGVNQAIDAVKGQVDKATSPNAPGIAGAGLGKATSEVREFARGGREQFDAGVNQGQSGLQKNLGDAGKAGQKALEDTASSQGSLIPDAGNALNSIKEKAMSIGSDVKGAISN